MNQDILALVIGVLLLFVQSAENQSYSDNKKPAEYSAKGGWLPIFNGENLDGWTLKVTGIQT